MTVKVSSIYVNLPVKDLSRSIAFFKALGFESNEEFTDDKGASLVMNESIFVMLLTEEFFASFTHQQIADISKENEVILALQVESKEEVDELVNKAIEHGAQDKTTALSEEEEAMMYYRRIKDLDGHLWEIMYMDMSAMAN
ncbi:VOC family protein [Carnobacterium sp. ISL-102]|uniref:VOC family protein n=1 Tax=Carnobacterium sp. ISL-102 TaxID=2819142 RepID=UPI001BE7AC3D|nr:VOC family protein [Carnobacterium sp. ISL-102]MBT2731144.1 VOC family protein [Carnobacterium sp. ISL-102]